MGPAVLASRLLIISLLTEKKVSRNVKQRRLALSDFLHLKASYILDEYFNSTKV